MGRRKSRETAMKFIYQTEINKDDWQAQISETVSDTKLSDNDASFTKELIFGVKENIEEIDKKIKEFSKGWKIDRIPKIDLAILRVSIYEICYNDDIPFNVSVNEAIELSKKYSTAESGTFINGVLSRLA
jgi:N utilization substance protein B